MRSLHDGAAVRQSRRGPFRSETCQTALLCATLLSVATPGALVLPALILPALVLTIPTSARADIYTRIDKQGTIHFTNIERPSHHWRRIMRTGPGKARAVHARRRSRRLSPERYRLYDEHIRQAAELYHIPEALIRAVTHVESDYDPQAISRAGAQGLMQLMPATARSMGVSNVFDPRQNIFGGTRYLRVLANQFAGDLVLTIASYHAGAGAVSKYDGIPPYATTQRYVRLVLSRYKRYRAREQARHTASSTQAPRSHDG